MWIRARFFVIDFFGQDSTCEIDIAIHEKCYFKIISPIAVCLKWLMSVARCGQFNDGVWTWSHSVNMLLLALLSLQSKGCPCQLLLFYLLVFSLVPPLNVCLNKVHLHYSYSHMHFGWQIGTLIFCLCILGLLQCKNSQMSWQGGYWVQCYFYIPVTKLMECVLE